ncbi:hypothetical protein RUM43_007926 [Polyplax serrata]|uniref:Uncharacterized protein n=1 Tax=Polyplax serrata TaxID=468196 RepID=A0AAN8PMW1_POLSC
MSKVKMMGMKPDDDEITTKNVKNHIIGRRLKNAKITRWLVTRKKYYAFERSVTEDSRTGEADEEEGKSEEDDKLRGNEYHLCQLTCARTPKEAEKIRKNKRKSPDIPRTNRKQTQWQPLQLQANNKRVASNRPSTSKVGDADSSGTNERERKKLLAMSFSFLRGDPSISFQFCPRGGGKYPDIQLGVDSSLSVPNQALLKIPENSGPT